MTLYWPPKETLDYEFKEDSELVLKIPLEANNRNRKNNPKGDMEK